MTRSIDKYAPLAALVSALAVAASGCGELLEQPPLGCPVQPGAWAVRYTLKAGQDADATCAQKPGELMGARLYNPPGSSEFQLALKPFTLADLEGSDPEHVTYSLGALPTEPNADSFCVAESLTPARQVVPEEGIDIGYSWANVAIVSKPEAPGSQLVADLTYSEGSCSAEYEAWAVWPAVFCDDADGNPSDAICNEEGHGLNLEFALVCDPTSYLCVPAQRPPSMK